MRIISGSRGGIPLQVPKNVTRPTTERTRGAIFNMLADLIPGARVLDLFAGSGAYGLEALSRGATHATFVEADRAAAEVIRGNISKAKFSAAEVTVLPLRVEAALPKFLPACADLIFADPPYKKQREDTDHLADLLASPTLAALLRPSGCLMVERFAKAPLPLPPGWQILQERTYGDCCVAFLRPTVEA